MISNNKLPLVSIIIPVYNVEFYLHQCLNSACSQTYKNLEIIVINDGSTDRSGAICDKYAKRDNRVKVFHTLNQGLSAARNCGVDHMSPETEYVAFIDSDDWMEENAIELMYEAACKYNAAVTCCSWQNEYVNGNKPSAMIDNVSVFKGNEVINSFIRDGFIANVAWNKLYKADLFKSVRYPVGKLFEDITTTYKIILNVDRLVVLQEPLIHYRMRGNSISKSHSVSCVIGRWEAYYERYVALSEYVPDDKIRQALIGSCLNPIDTVWRWYYSFSKEERIQVDPVLDEMQAFISEHYDDVIHTSEYSRRQKVTCVFARSRNPLMMRMLYAATRVYRVVRRDKMFE